MLFQPKKKKKYILSNFKNKIILAMVFAQISSLLKIQI